MAEPAGKYVSLLVVLTIALAGIHAVPSDATPLTGENNRLGEAVSLAPGNGPNSEYTDVENGELVIDVSGSNPALIDGGVNLDAVTTFDDVFYITQLCTLASAVE